MEKLAHISPRPQGLFLLCAWFLGCSASPHAESHRDDRPASHGENAGTAATAGASGEVGFGGDSGSAGAPGAAGAPSTAGSGGRGEASGAGGSGGLEEPWVEVLSPTPGETVPNPVTISFAAGGGVTHVTFQADGWPLHPSPLEASTGTFEYSFSGLGYERHLLMTGLDAQGGPVATHWVAFTPVVADGTFVFPLDLNHSGTLTPFDTPGSDVSFGAPRDGGRLHAGCDLYWYDSSGWPYHPLNDNTPIYAVADGTILDYYLFYLGTYALEVEHGDFVVRYGEVDGGGLPNGLSIGSHVNAGQQIATMGDLELGSEYASMLHFELYSGQLIGSLTDASNTTYLHVPPGNYQRRGDLLDCGPFLRALIP